MLSYDEAARIMMGDGSRNILSTLVIFKNDIYEPGLGYGIEYDGVRKIDVQIPEPKLQANKECSQNNTTVYPDDGFVALESVTVNIPIPSYITNELNVTANGTYHAADYECDGFDPVNVNVKSIYEELWRIEHPDSPDPENITLPDGTVVSGIPAFPKPTSGVDPSKAAADNPQTYVTEDGCLKVEIKVEEKDGNKYPYTVITNTETGKSVENHDPSGLYRTGFTDGKWEIYNLQYLPEYGRMTITYSVSKRGYTANYSTSSAISYSGNNIYYMTPNY